MQTSDLFFMILPFEFSVLLLYLVLFPCLCPHKFFWLGRLNDAKNCSELHNGHDPCTRITSVSCLQHDPCVVSVQWEPAQTDYQRTGFESLLYHGNSPQDVKSKLLLTRRKLYQGLRNLKVTWWHFALTLFSCHWGKSVRPKALPP